MKKSHRFPRCLSTGKIRFPQHNDATQAVSSARRMRSHAAVHGGTCTNKVERSYRCVDCLGWHLTSQPRQAHLPRLTGHVALRIHTALSESVR